MAKLVYKKAGSIELVRRSDLTRFLQTGVVESIEPSINQKTTTLPDGNSDYDLEFSAGKDAQVVVNFSTFVPKIYAAFCGATMTENSSFGIRHILQKTIPSASSYTIDVSSDAGTPAADPVPVVHDAADSPYVKVSADPAAGQFSVSGSVFTFSSANAGTEVALAFDVSTTADKMEVPAESNRPLFELRIAGNAVLADDEGTTKADAWIFDTVSPTGDIKPPIRKKEPAGWSVTFKMQKPRPGYKAVDYRVAR